MTFVVLLLFVVYTSMVLLFKMTWKLSNQYNDARGYSLGAAAVRWCSNLRDSHRILNNKKKDDDDHHDDDGMLIYYWWLRRGGSSPIGTKKPFSFRSASLVGTSEEYVVATFEKSFADELVAVAGSVLSMILPSMPLLMIPVGDPSPMLVVA